MIYEEIKLPLLEGIVAQGLMDKAYVKSALGKKPNQLPVLYRFGRTGKDFMLTLHPLHTPRPRGRIMKMGKKVSVHMYQPPDYMAYKELMAMYFAKVKINLEGPIALMAVIGITYNESEAKKRRIEGAIHSVRPDYDNYIKGLGDSLSDSGAIPDDGCISDGFIMKRYTNIPSGFILFRVVKAPLLPDQLQDFLNTYEGVKDMFNPQIQFDPL